MKFLVVAATSMEIAPFLAHRDALNTVPRMHTDLLITGIGLTAATYQLATHLIQNKFDIVIQAGIAGALDPNLLPGEVVVVDRDLIADEGVVEGGEFKSLFDMNLLQRNQSPYQDGWLINPHADNILKSGLPTVRAITVNEISTANERIHWYRNRYHAAVESMEGAALHYCCLMQNTPFLQLRAISNHAGERNKSKWNFKDAIGNLNAAVINIIEQL